ncbi:Outer membrane receptor protein [Rubrivivax sp. A210]|uniref:TonB-dependent receptor n=1 Tax=Rubrivivax sp. A210 TaxID=2772301 RepID=UPI00191AEB81|nr:TonB-dependent receptor [Rubrivivax sp. A210]CAD5373828.1 Outer membrane receptor protein [Rubrivivax sp. A210]
MSAPIPARLSAVALACLCAGASPALLAAEADADIQAIDGVVVVTGQRESRLPAALAPVAATVESLTATQIEKSINTVTTAGALQYLPSMHVRERYIGDRNGVLVMRVNSSIASAQTTVYADGLLLSNFLANSFSTAPRWGLVAPEEIERIDTIYGPFSALYPGNSAGGVVYMTTRLPQKFEAHVRLDAFGQRFQEYGSNASFEGNHASASLGDAVGDFAYWVSLDHLDNRGHPQTFGNTTAKTGAPAAAGTFTDVSGSQVYRDIDTAGRPRIMVSSTGIDHTAQDLTKLKLAWRPRPGLSASYTLGLWQNKSDTTVDSYLRDASGRTVFNAGASLANPFKFVRIDGQDYTVSAAAPSRSESEHWMHGLSLRAKHGAWDWDLIASLYDQKKDVTRSATPANGYDTGLAELHPGGQLTLADGTGWSNLDLRGQWQGSEGGIAGAHRISFGLHHDRYELASVTTVVSDWLAGDGGTLNTNSYGKTQTQALYLQDEWKFAPDWTLVAGGRFESWKAFGGSNFNAANAAPNPKNLVYGDREQSDFSPKLHLGWQAQEGLALTASVGKGVRYPTVNEMFQTFNGPGGIRTNDPHLKPEQVVSWELVAKQELGRSLLRASLFHEDKRDALISQTDTTVTPNISSIQNVDKVRTDGIELAWNLRDVVRRGFDLDGSVTYTHSQIVRDSRNPALEGSRQPRIPDWRATLVGTWHASEALSLSASFRYSGRQHAQLLNTTTGRYNDPNPNVYGAVSSYRVFDAKALYRITPQWSASLGINNIGNYRYYVNPNPYPQRTWFAGLKYDL